MAVEDSNKQACVETSESVMYVVRGENVCELREKREG